MKKTLRKITTVIINVVIILIITGLLLFFLDWVASFWVTKPTSNLIEHPRLNHAWRPNYKNTFPGHGKNYPNSYTHYYNKQGWIAKYDIALKKPKDTYRIFYVGDSFTEGVMPMEQSVPSIVQQVLNDKFSNKGINFEVINTGTSSYGNVIYYILIRYFITQYHPDVVVINVDMTDSYDDWVYKHNTIFDKNGDPWAVPPLLLHERLFIDTPDGLVKANFNNTLKLFLFKNSNLYNLYIKLFKEKKYTNKANLEKYFKKEIKDNPVVFNRFSWCTYEWDQNILDSVMFSHSILVKIGEYCKQNNIKLVLTGVPHWEQFTFNNQEKPKWSLRPFSVIKDAAERTGAFYLDSYSPLLPLLKDTPQNMFYYENDMHFNPKGNALWAIIHAEMFIDPKNKLLPEKAY
ncbi:MAG: hypothetical protein HQL25_00730 [Candidatus Omnitrophica bacterium]|nr:hypothetical protein [Candidatus Omnitrophota bacterium]